FEGDVARERARQRLLRAAKKYGIAPLGFFDGQLKKERRQGQIDAGTARIARLPAGVVTFLLADVEGSTKMARLLGDDWPGLLRRPRRPDIAFQRGARRLAGIDAHRDRLPRDGSIPARGPGCAGGALSAGGVWPGDGLSQVAGKACGQTVIRRSAGRQLAA